MQLPSELQRIAPILGVAVLAVAGLLLVTRVIGGGTESGSGEDAAAIFDKAVTQSPRTAVLGLDLLFSLERSDDPGSRRRANVSARGPLAESGAGKFDRADLNVVEGGSGPDAKVQLRSTGSRGYVRAGGQWYRLSQPQFAQVFEDQRKGGTFMSDLGFDLKLWVKNPRIVGSVPVDGVDTYHLTGDLDPAGLPAALNENGDFDPDLVTFFSGNQRNSKVDLFVGKSDGQLRKADLAATYGGQLNGQTINGELDLSVTFRQLDRPVKIAAPAAALPPSALADVDPKVLGSTADDLKAASRNPRGSKAKGGSATKDSQAYVSCVQQATSTAALEKCQALVP